MNKYVLLVSQNGGEYYAQVKVKADEVEQINYNTVKINGAELVFEHEHIQSVNLDE